MSANKTCIRISVTNEYLIKIPNSDKSEENVVLFKLNFR